MAIILTVAAKLRVWEQSGESGLCEIFAGKERWSGTTCEFERRSNGNPVKIQNGVFKIELGKFEPASYLIY